MKENLLYSPSIPSPTHFVASSSFLISPLFLSFVPPSKLYAYWRQPHRTQTHTRVYSRKLYGIKARGRKRAWLPTQKLTDSGGEDEQQATSGQTVEQSPAVSRISRLKEEAL